jgi:hypothetical protein
MKCTVAIACFAILALESLPALRADEKVDIAGSYEAKGINPNGGTYEATVEIKKNGDTYTIKWDITGANETYEGIGILEGDVLSVSYKSGDATGVVAYKVSKGKLDGKWSPGDGKVYTETLKKK